MPCRGVRCPRGKVAQEERCKGMDWGCRGSDPVNRVWEGSTLLRETRGIFIHLFPQGWGRGRGRDSACKVFRGDKLDRLGRWSPIWVNSTVL